jgi:hypothetical protein
MLPAIFALGAWVLAKAGTAEVTGRLISHRGGYRNGEGPLSQQTLVRVALDSEDDFGRFAAIAAYHKPDVMGPITGKTYRLTVATEYEELKTLISSASTFVDFNSEEALKPLAHFFNNFPQARVK